MANSNIEYILRKKSTWDDLRFPLNTIAQGQLNPPDYEQFRDDGAGSVGVFAYHFDPTTEEEMFFTTQLPHRWDQGTELHPHIHWSPTTAVAGDVVWGLEYIIFNPTGAIPATTTTLTATASTNASTDAQVTMFGTINGTGFTESAQLCCRVYRAAGDAADTYTADAVAFEIDIHFLAVKHGTLTQIPVYNP
jgi:hypothetical protein